MRLPIVAQDRIAGCREEVSAVTDDCLIPGVGKTAANVLPGAAIVCAAQHTRTVGENQRLGDRVSVQCFGPAVRHAIGGELHPGHATVKRNPHAVGLRADDPCAAVVAEPNSVPNAPCTSGRMFDPRRPAICTLNEARRAAVPEVVKGREQVVWSEGVRRDRVDVSGANRSSYRITCGERVNPRYAMIC